MLIIPAIDLKGGQCVRLIQGKKDQETVYSSDPSAMARRWEAQGAELIHVVDLDGAFDGRPKNLEAVKQILEAINIPIQLGGGIRDISTIEALINLGVARVILGTKVITEPDLIKIACDRFKERIIVGIDAQDGYVAIRGWQEVTRSEAIPLAQQVEAMGVSRLIFTDIARDGCLRGPNFASIEKMTKSVNLEVIASGGISSLEDIKKLKRIGVEGCIIGKALYEGRFDLEEAREVSSFGLCSCRSTKLETRNPKLKRAMDRKKEVKELIKKGKQKGHVTYEEIHEIFPENGSHSEVENFLAKLEQMKIAVVDNPVVATEEEPSYYVEDPVKIYLKEISQIPLLTAQEEIELGKEIKTGEDEIATIEKNFHLSSDKVRTLFEDWKEGAIRQDDLPKSLKKMSTDELERTVLQIELLQDKVRQAKRKFTEANLRLVVNVAKRYASDKLAFLDLINEGNLGLMRAVDKFNYQSGYRFSTYAIWWIRQSIIRALADKGRMIRLPVPIIEMINKCMKVTRELSYELGREPSLEDIAARLELPVSKIIEIVNTAEDARSLEAPHGFESEGELGDYVENKESLSPTGATFLKMLRQSLEELLEGLSQREQIVLRLRYGLEGEKPHILEEIGKSLGVTRERARQIEVTAIQKLRHKKISTALRDFLIE